MPETPRVEHEGRSSVCQRILALILWPMSRYFCHEHPDILILETRVVDARPGGVVLEQSPFHPGGGGQLADRGLLRWHGGEARVTGIEAAGDGRYWHLLADGVEPAGAVEARVDAGFRSMMAQLHTDTHILNALVFQHFQGALVTGAQLNEDGTARMDFDLPEADNDRLRALEPEINDVIRQDLAVRTRTSAMPMRCPSTALVRNRSVRRLDDDGRSAWWRSGGPSPSSAEPSCLDRGFPPLRFLKIATGPAQPPREIGLATSRV